MTDKAPKSSRQVKYYKEFIHTIIKIGLMSRFKGSQRQKYNLH